MTMHSPWGDGRPDRPTGNQDREPWWSGLSQLRPSSPGQLALFGLGVLAVGLFIPAMGMLGLVGIALIVLAGISYLMRPRQREQYWRGRRIDVDGPPSTVERLYRLIYRR